MRGFKFGKKKSAVEIEVERVSKILVETDIALAPLMDFKMNDKHKTTFNYLWRDFWEEHVPRSGQSSVLQAEMLRRIEKLEHEATENGNINWDENFKYFCDWLLTTFSKFEEVSGYLKNAALILTKLKNHGR